LNKGGAVGTGVDPLAKGKVAQKEKSRRAVVVPNRRKEKPHHAEEI